MKIIFFVFFLFSCQDALAQRNERQLIDSLQKAITVAENDTIKVRLYNRLYNELSYINTVEAMQYARIGLAHAQKMKWQKGVAVFQNNLGRSFSDIGNYDSAFFYYNAALKTHSNAKDKYNMASTNNNLGAAAQNLRSDYTTAAKYYFTALKLAEEMNDSTMLSISLSNVARIYMLQKNYTKAIEYDNKALRILEKKGTSDEIASSYESIGKTYYSTTNLSKAKEYFQKAMSLYESTGNIAGLASVWSSLSLVYSNDYRSVVEARIKSKQLWNEVNPMHPDAINNTGNLGLAYLDIVRYDTNHTVKYGDIIPKNKTLLLQKAEQNLKASIQLSDQTGDIDNKSYFTGVLAEVQELKGDFKNAFYNFKLFKETQDSLFSQENKNKIATAESQREIDKKNSELKINELALSNQQKTMWGLFGGLALLSTIGVLFYKQSQQRKQTNNTLVKLNTELDNANKVKAKFFAILSHDLRAPVAKLISFLNLQKNDPDFLSTEQTARHQKKITYSAEALLENMEAMLLWSKSQMENFKPVKNKVATSILFEQLSKNFTATEAVKINFPDGETVFVNTDENYLLTIMQNLTANAVSALKNKSGAIINWNVKSTKDFIVFSIHDNGPGLPAEVIRILNDNATNLGSKNGLGFHIIKDMAKAINCSISFQSNAEGTRFNLEMPY